ncbi:MAG: ankyrin repeat domain-containing protein, partial [Synergistaceae bacterium]|nr:ankyrin repeat domain-containing protein [Synergistaceae bacterium]
SVIDGDSEDGIIQSLLEAGANPDIQDSKGQTALMWAVLDRDRSSEFLISALIRTGGLNIKEGVLWISAVALFTAAKREVQLDIIKNLIQYGANISIRDNNGMNAFMCAMLNLDDEIVDILKAAGTFELGVN